MGILNIKKETAMYNISNRQYYVEVVDGDNNLLGWEVHTPLEEVQGYNKLINLAKSLGAHSVGEDTDITWFMPFEHNDERPVGTDETKKSCVSAFSSKEAAAEYTIKKCICNMVSRFLRLHEEMKFDTIVGYNRVQYKRGTLFNETEGYEIFANKDRKFMVDSTSKLVAFVMISLTDCDNEKTRTVRVELDRKSRTGSKIQAERKLNMFNSADGVNYYTKTMISLAGAFFVKMRDALDGFDLLNGAVITEMNVRHGKTLDVSKPKLSDFNARVTVIGYNDHIKATKIVKVVKLTGIDTLIAEPEEMSSDYVAMKDKLMDKLGDAYDERVTAGVVTEASGNYETKLKSINNGSVVLTDYDVELFSQATDIY